MAAYMGAGATGSASADDDWLTLAEPTAPSGRLGGRLRLRPHPADALAEHRSVVPAEAQGVVGSVAAELPQQSVGRNVVVEENVPLAVLDERDHVSRPFHRRAPRPTSLPPASSRGRPSQY